MELNFNLFFSKIWIFDRWCKSGSWKWNFKILVQVVSQTKLVW